MDLELTATGGCYGRQPGIGLAVARVLVAEGADVALIARDQQSLQRSAAELGNALGTTTCTGLGASSPRRRV
jgi:NADP-dependent 3-hydroxy acid dehydrogenase YdfG